MMAVIFMLPRAEEMYLSFAQDGCHFYAAKKCTYHLIRMVAHADKLHF